MEHLLTEMARRILIGHWNDEGSWGSHVMSRKINHWTKFMLSTDENSFQMFNKV